MSIEDAVKRLKGEAGTSVTLTVAHVGSGKRETVTVDRELIHVETVLGDHRRDDDSWDFMLDPDKHIGYIRITGFSRDTAQDLKRGRCEGLKGARAEGADSRLAFQSRRPADFGHRDQRPVRQPGADRQHPGPQHAERTWEAQEEGTFEGFPIAVLVNRYSARRQRNRLRLLAGPPSAAVVIGERTWGKGSVQNVIELEGGR